MIYLKLFENYFSDETIANKEINGTYYHGTVISNGDGFFDYLDEEYSDWDAIWFSDDFNIAEEFSENRNNDDHDTLVIFKVKLKSKEIADIDYELSQELIEYYGLSDFREIIPILISKGFDGWSINGSIGPTIYDDIAIFGDNLEDIIEYQSVCFKQPNKEWSKFVPIDGGKNYFEKLLKIKTS